MKILLVIDMQNDFAKKGGTLSSPVTEKIVPKIVERVEAAEKNKEVLIFTQDTHEEEYLDTLEGRNLPIPHCLVNTDGWEIVAELKDFAKERVYKISFGSFYLAELVTELIREEFEDAEIEVCGLLSSICVVTNCLILRTALPNTKIVVNSNLCADVTEESHLAAMTVLKSCQIEVI